MKRLFDFILAAAALVCVAPIVVLAMIGVKITSPGPVFYVAQRVGQGGHLFSMYKLRTMHVVQDSASSITAPGDTRVFGFGRVIRRLKIDELPQFWNILIGDMSFVGPRPEAPDIVDAHYTSWMHETLQIRPGVTSPGAIYGYAMTDRLLDDDDPEGSYVDNMLSPKLAIDRAYVDQSSFLIDLQYIVMTAWAIVCNALGRPVVLPLNVETAARAWAPKGPYTNDLT